MKNERLNENIVKRIKSKNQATSIKTTPKVSTKELLADANTLFKIALI